MRWIFLSYCRHDSLIKDYLHGRLEVSGFELWIDGGRLKVGAQSDQAIVEAIRDHADAMVVILTPAAFKSKWVNIEIRLAQLHQVKIFPVLAYGDETTSVPPSILLEEYADMRGRQDYEAGLRKLVDALREHTVHS